MHLLPFQFKASNSIDRLHLLIHGNHNYQFMNKMVLGRAMVIWQILRRLPDFFVVAVVVLTFSVISTHAQMNPPEPQQYNFNQRFSTTSAIVIVVLMLAFFLTGFMFIFFHCRRVANDNLLLAARSEGAGNNGLSTEVIDSFPTIVYSEVEGLKMGNSPLECAVCLCEFEDHDELTLLPKCDHAFHPQCIGLWLANHTTCPVCRINLGVPEPEVVTDGTSPTPVNSGSDENIVELDEQLPQPEHVTVKVEEEDKEDKELRTIGSTSKRTLSTRVLRRWRSRSARLSTGGGDGIGNTWGEDERERFTLRVPENLRKELIEGKSTLRRSASVTTSRYPFNNGVGEESSRSTFRIQGPPRGKTSRPGKSWTEKFISSSSGPLDCIGAGGRNGAGSDKDDSKKSTADLLPRV